MKTMTLEQIARACDGQVVSGDPHTSISGVSTDTRTLAAGELFVALRGETHNGHDYAARASEKGAAAVMVCGGADVECAVLQVEDTLLAYGRLGAAARAASTAKVLAVTGSAGKTTTKDMLGGIAELDGRALVAPGTENNEIGVPRVLLQLTPEHEYCVLELAMRGRGEIAYLAEICNPQMGIITNIGEAHVGRLGSRDAIAQAKSELVSALPEDGTAVLNADDFFFGLLADLAPCRVVSFGFGEKPEEADAHVTAEDIRSHGTDPARFVMRCGADSSPIRLQVPGRHNVANALAAGAAALAAGVSCDAVKAGLESFSGTAMRSEVLQAPDGLVIVDDSYNASPTSTPEAVRLLAECGGRRVFVFGDMLELGEASERAHRDVGRLVAKLDIDWLITVGEAASAAAEEADAGGIQVNVVEDAAGALALLAGVLGEGDTVLVKASRGIALDRVSRGLMGNG